MNYTLAQAALEAGDYKTAIQGFRKLGRYIGTSSTQLKEARYLLGKQYLERGNTDQALIYLKSAQDYQDSAALVEQIEAKGRDDRLVGTWIKDALFMTFYADGSVIQKTNREILREGTYQIVQSGKTYNLEMAFANGSSDVWTIAFVSGNEFERLYKNYYGRDEWHTYRRVRE